MSDYCDASNRLTDCRRDGLRRKSGRNETGREGGFRSLRRWGILTAVLLTGGCSWFTDDEPAFPPTAGGPNIATVPEGLGSDTANAEYSDQDLSVQTESAPRPAPPPPPEPPKAPEAEAAPSTPAPTASTTAPAGSTSAPTDSTSAPTGSTEQTGTPPAGNTPAATPAPSAAGKTDKGSYPDINSVPMQAPTPVPDPDAPPATEPAKPADPQKSSQAAPAAGNQVAALASSNELDITTAAGTLPGAASDKEADLAQAVAAQTTVDDDNGVMFSKPSLPPYIPYDQMQKQAQTGEHAPYSTISETGGNAPIPLGQVQPGQSSGIGQAVNVEEPGVGQSFGVQAGAEPVGLVYFSDGSVNLSGDDRRILQQIAKLQQTFGGVIRIVGHASSRTENMPIEHHMKSNVDVSVARAAAVARQLVRLGVNPNFVQVAGVSDSRPVYPEIMPAGEAANRRAEIYLSSN